MGILNGRSNISFGSKSSKDELPITILNYPTNQLLKFITLILILNIIIYSKHLGSYLNYRNTEFEFIHVG